PCTGCGGGLARRRSTRRGRRAPARRVRPRYGRRAGASSSSFQVRAEQVPESRAEHIACEVGDEPATHPPAAPIAMLHDPRLVGGIAYKKFETPDVSDSGSKRVAFLARTADRGVCIFRVDPAGPDDAPVCKGNVAPDGHVFRSFGPAKINDFSTAIWGSAESG